MQNTILDYLPSYPNINDPKLSYEILRLKEFHDIQLGPTEDVPTTPDTPLLTQKIESRAFNPHTPYPGEVVFGEPGTGKTCTTEFIIDTFLNSPNTRALIISPAEVLKENFARDIAKKCATSKFTVKFEGNILDKKRGAAKEKCKNSINERKCIEDFLKAGEEKASMKKVRKTYDMKTFREMYLSIRSMKDEELKSTYSHRVIFIDEAHLLRNDEKTKEPYYDEFKRLVDVAEGLRIFLLTGTPIWDKIEDIASLFNLLLTKSQRLKTGSEFLRTYITKSNTLNPKTIPELRKAFHGRVSFLRSLSSTAKREFVGVTSPWMKHMTIFPVAMSGFQKETSETLEAEEKGENGRNVDNGFKVKSREASNFVAPDYDPKAKELEIVQKKGIAVPLYGSEFFNKAIEFNKKTERYQYVRSDYLAYISESLDEYSSKLNFIANYSDSNPKEVMWVYNKSVKTGSGVINDALILASLKDEHGKKRFQWARSIEDLKTPSNTPKFIVISSEIGTFHTPSEITKVLDIVSSPENKYGKLCKIVIGTKKGVLGLTIKNARCAIIKFPHWNASEIDQALARALRVGSAANFDDESERYLKIFLLASVNEAEDKGVNKGKGYPPNVAFDPKETVDVMIYKTAENKDFISKQIYRLMKEGAWNCAVDYGRNVLETDVDGSRFADYDKANYKCEGYPEENIDKSGKVWKYDVPSSEIITSNYNSFYSVDDEVMANLKVLFQNYGCLRFEDLKRLIMVDELVLLGTLKHIIEKSVEMKDRFGFTRYLDEDSDVYFLKGSQTKSTYYDSYYVSYPIINEPLRVVDIVEHLQLEEDKGKIKTYCKGDDDEPFAEFVKTLNYRTKAFLVEQLALDDLDKAFKLFPNNIFRSERFVWHNFYQMESKGIKYAKKDKSLVRILEGKEWRFVQKGWELDQLTTTSKPKTSEILVFNKELSEKLQLTSNIHGDEFKVKDLTKSKPTSQGTICRYRDKKFLWTWMWELHKNGSEIFSEPVTDPKVLKKYSVGGLEGIRDALMGMETGPEAKIYGDKTKNIPAATEKNKNVLMSMLRMTALNKGELCDILQKWFLKAGLVLERK